MILISLSALLCCQSKKPNNSTAFEGAKISRKFVVLLDNNVSKKTKSSDHFLKVRKVFWIVCCCSCSDVAAEVYYMV